MPIFEYTCLKCAHRFEKLQKSSTVASTECPECGSFDVRKELSAFSSAVSSSSTAGAAGCYSGG